MPMESNAPPTMTRLNERYLLPFKVTFTYSEPTVTLVIYTAVKKQE